MAEGTEYFPLSDKDFLSSKKRRHEKAVDDQSAFDPFYGIRVVQPRFTLDVFNNYCQTLMKVKMGVLPNLKDTGNIVLMGVIVESSGTKKTTNNKEYMVWQLSDLLSDIVIRLLVFNDAVSVHGKLEPGFVVAVTNADLMENNNISGRSNAAQHNQVLTLKVVKATQILEIGSCPDYGLCTTTCKNGDPCTNFVNLSLSFVCTYHIQAEANRMRSIRGSLSAISNETPKCAVIRSPTKSARKPSSSRKRSRPNQPGTPSTPQTPVDRSKLAKKARLGHKVMSRLAEIIDKENAEPKTSPFTPKTPRLTNLKDFLNSKNELDRIRHIALKAGGTPQLGRSVHLGNMAADLFSSVKIWFAPPYNDESINKEELITQQYIIHIKSGSSDIAALEVRAIMIRGLNYTDPSLDETVTNKL